MVIMGCADARKLLGTLSIFQVTRISLYRRLDNVILNSIMIFSLNDYVITYSYVMEIVI